MAARSAEVPAGGAAIARTLDPRVKMFYLVWIFLMVSILMHPLVLFAIFLVTLAGIFAAKLSVLAVARSARIGLLIALASWLLWIVFLRAQGTVLLAVGSFHVTEPGIYNGCSVACRIASILFAFLAVFRTTTNREVMTALYRLHVSVPFAMVIGITLRLIPQLQAEHAIIIEAQRSRAVEFDQGSLLARMRKHTSYIVPLVLRALKITSDLSLAMEARAFDAYAPRTFSESFEFRPRDYLLLILMGLSLGAAVVLRLLGFGGMPLQWLAR